MVVESRVLLYSPDLLLVGPKLHLGFDEFGVGMPKVWRAKRPSLTDPAIPFLREVQARGAALRAHGSIDRRRWRWLIRFRDRVSLLPPFPIRRADFSHGF